VGLVAGGVFGAAQQLRGAHFLSHDLWTLATCWTVSLLLFLLVRRITARGVRA
jgi:membrane-associated PAP2 superfamily phosphatase